MRNLSDGLRVAGLLLCLFFGLSMVALGQQAGNANKPQLRSMDVYRLSIKGHGLSSGDAEKLEQALVSDPTNLATRLTLISYYSTRSDEPFRLKKSEHVLWVIRNVPDSEALHDDPQLRLIQLDKGFAEARQLWLKHLDTYKGNLVVLTNAADFFLMSDKPLAEQLLKQGAAADAGNPRWPMLLGYLYLVQKDSTTATTPRSLAAKAYPQFELAYKLSSDEQGKHMLLSQLITSAFEAGDVEQAKSWALATLNQGSNARTDLSLADSVHHAHIILGRIALLSGGLTEAREQLIEAGKTQGSPVLGSFGPNMLLAKELLERGERETVIQYFQECAGFWKLRGERLNEWTATVKGGGMPNFGANLVY